MNPFPTEAKPAASRRDFIKQTAAAALAVASAPLAPPTVYGQAPFAGRVLGANDRIGVGFIGAGGRGRTHLAVVQGLIKSGENLQITAVCDAFRYRLDQATRLTNSKGYMRHLDLLADSAVDVVCVATPDRLHVSQARDAIRAGKDVYCEKPLGHWSQFEACRDFGQETARRQRIVQVGNQGNSSPAWGKVRELVQQGAIGRLQHVMAGYYRNGDWGERMPIPDREAKPGPDLDWEGFLGDAPKVPFTLDRFFSWRKYLDYAGGPCTDLFPHVLTPFVSALGLNYPALAVASGGIFKYNTYDREVPDTFNMSLDYPEGASAVLVCTLANEYSTEPAIRGDEGTLTLQNAGGWEGGFDSITVIPHKGDRRVVPGLRTEATPLHWKNLLHCVRTREKPVSDVEFALKVQAAMCMAMLAFLQKKVARFDPQKREILL